MCYFDGHLKQLTTIPDNMLAPIRQKLQDNPAIWHLGQDEKPNNFDVFAGNTLHIVLQFPFQRQNHWPARYFPVWEEWKPLLSPIVQFATASYEYKHGRTSRMMLARLLPRSKSKMHIDHTPSANLPHKIHIPIQTHPLIEFLIEDKHYHLPVGEVVEVNNKLIHGTNNPTDFDRIHLIFDYFDLKRANINRLEEAAS